MATSRRQVFRLSRERRVADIMSAAREVFRERGYEDASMSDIAERANVVEGSIYRYFENKRDLLVKVIEAWYEEMLTDYERHLAAIKGTRNRLHFMVWRHLRTLHDEPALSNLMLRFLRTDPQYRQTSVYTLNKEYTRRTLDIVKEGIEIGELRDDVPLRLIRNMIYGCIEHQTWSYLRGEGDFNTDGAAEGIVDLVMTGLQRKQQPSEDDLMRRLELAVHQLERLASSS